MIPSPRLHSLTLACWLFGLIVGVRPLSAAPPRPSAPPASGQSSLLAGDEVDRGGLMALLRVGDVALQQEGTFEGRVFYGAGQRNPVAAGGLSVVLLRRDQPVAQTATDADGRFAVSHLAGGVYQVVVGTPQGPCRRQCRLWPPGAAPPHAQREMALACDGPLARGQSPIPAANFPQVATIAGIAAGAIAAPAIYAATRREPWIPASP